MKQKIIKSPKDEGFKRIQKRAAELEKIKTEFEQYKKQKIEYELRMEGLLASMDDVVFAFDKEGKFIFYHTPNSEELYLPPEVFMGKKPQTIMPTHIIKIFEEAFSSNKKGEKAEVEYHLEIKGKKCWYTAKFSPLYIDKNFSGSIAVIRNITDRKKLELRLKKSHDNLEQLVQLRTKDLELTNKKLLFEINERKSCEGCLKKSNLELQIKKKSLEDKNIALHEIINQIELGKKKIKENIEFNLKIAIFPILDKMRLENNDTENIDALKHHINNLVSSYGIEITKTHHNLSPKEIEICNLVKGGMASKEIADLLKISFRTVEKHRRNIRHKLGIVNKQINLSSFLRDL